MTTIYKPKFGIGDIVHHKVFPFRGVIYDIDPVFSNKEEWLLSIPEQFRPHRNQPFYHMFTENNDSGYAAYVSEQNLVHDSSREPVQHPEIERVFTRLPSGEYRLRVVHQH